MSLPLPDAATAETLCRTAVGQLQFARRYTLELLEQTPRDRWYEIPQGAPSHLAWQVGHLAVSQYGLLMFRLRGRRPEDLELIPGRFRKAFGRGSTPQPDPSGQPTAEELLGRLAEVDRRAMEEVATVEGSTLLEPVEMPYAVYPNKLGAVLFAPLHEQIHAGQIGLLRRLLQLEPVR